MHFSFCTNVTELYIYIYRRGSTQLSSVCCIASIRRNDTSYYLFPPHCVLDILFTLFQEKKINDELRETRTFQKNCSDERDAQILTKCAPYIINIPLRATSCTISISLFRNLINLE